MSLRKRFVWLCLMLVFAVACAPSARPASTTRQTGAPNWPANPAAIAAYQGADRQQMLEAGAHYEYLWRYGFRARPQCRPLKGSNWNSCGGSITSVSNPHTHPMSVVATGDLDYLA